MTSDATLEEAIEQLQQLGLKEYEARCFVGLSRLSSGTAKKLSEITDVPRTRVYDAIRVLETKGLVEIHHSSPQRFRAVSIEEAIETLRAQYDDRLDRVHRALEDIDPVESGGDGTVQEVWSMNGSDAIANRTADLIDEANDEVVLVIGHESILSEGLLETLAGVDSEVDLFVGTVTDDLGERVRDAVPGVETFTSGLTWLQNGGGHDKASVGRLLLVDRSAMLISSIVADTGEEQAIYGEGLGNGFIVLARRLMAQGLLPAPKSQ